MITTKDIEARLLLRFKYLQNICVLNVKEGRLVNFETDLLVLTKSRYAYGVEIKVSKSDLKNDLRKRKYIRAKNALDDTEDFLKKHYYYRFKRFYYAVPESILNETREIAPSFCGILSIGAFIEEVREPKTINNTKWSVEDALRLATLGNIRFNSYKIQQQEKRLFMKD